MTRAATGWIFVGVQAVLIIGLVILPGRSDWPTPGWLVFVGTALFFGGLVLMAVSALGLGAALTPTPVPKESGQLQTSGLYGLVRHPIYTGVLTLVAGVTVRSGSFVVLAVAVITFVFFGFKARWEETQLALTYPDYESYKKQTPRFFPRLPGS